MKNYTRNLQFSWFSDKELSQDYIFTLFNIPRTEGWGSLKNKTLYCCLFLNSIFSNNEHKFVSLRKIIQQGSREEIVNFCTLYVDLYFDICQFQDISLELFLECLEDEIESLLNTDEFTEYSLLKFVLLKSNLANRKHNIVQYVDEKLNNMYMWR